MEVLVGPSCVRSTQEPNRNKALYTNKKKVNFDNFFFKTKVDLKKNLELFQKILISQ